MRRQNSPTSEEDRYVWPGRVRPGKIGLVTAVAGFIIIYVVGLASDAWFVVHRRDVTDKVIANMGIFNACGGYNSNLTIVKPKFNTLSLRTSIYDSSCFSLFQSEDVPGWFQAVQGLSILCLCLLLTAFFLWTYIICISDLGDKRIRNPFIILWILTGVVLLIHPIIFASYMRPDRQVTEFSDDVPHLYDTVVITKLYWLGFYLHCIVAGGANFTTLVVASCVYYFSYR